MFPGQGSQHKGMGEGLFEEFAGLTARADAILGYSVKELCLHDPLERLGQTQFTQPAVYVVNALCYLKKSAAGVRPDCLLGHSLGELSALFAAGAFDFEAGLELVKKRGELMAAVSGGGMAAVLNLDAEKVAASFRRCGLDSLDIANFNSPGQVVIAGPKDDLARVQVELEQAGGVYIPLNLSAPFHSRYMRAAKEAFGDYLESFRFGTLNVPVISNVHARPYASAEIADCLREQVTSPVRWTESIRLLLAAGAEQFDEIGPGTVLANLLAKIRRGAANRAFAAG